MSKTILNENLKKDSAMAKLLKKEEAEIPERGDVIDGKVLTVTKNEILVDLGTLGMGVVRGREWFDVMDAYIDLDEGDKISASVMNIENERGQVELSLRTAGREKAWDEIKELKDKSKAIDVIIHEANKGGLITTLKGVQAFIPVSQLSSEHYPRVEGGDKNMILDKLLKYVGKDFKVKILDIDPDEDKLILSEKEAEMEKKKDVLKKLKVGEKIEGKISGVVDFGAFVEFKKEGKDLEGLIHISELAWKRIDNPKDVVKVGETIEAEIIGIDIGRISLSLKKLQEDPWTKSVKKYEIGSLVKGKITKITPFGAFVQLDSEIHGLAHVSELSGKGEKPSDILSLGEEHEFKILSIEPEEHRLGLSLKKTKGSEDSKKTKEEKKESSKPFQEKKLSTEKKPEAKAVKAEIKEENKLKTEADKKQGKKEAKKEDKKSKDKEKKKKSKKEDKRGNKKGKSKA